MGIQINIAANGRMIVPADVRKRLGMELGGTLVLSEGEFGITLSTAAQRVAKAQALYREYSKGKPDFTVDDFLAEKRAEAALEEILSTVILDASAVIAVLKREAGWEVVRSVILGSKLAANNLGEVAQRVLKDGWTRSQIEDAVSALEVEIVSVDGPLALDAAEFREIARQKGLSQADCICLALAKRMGVVAMTSDQKWLEIADTVGVEVQVIR